jgi:indole-3-glycerol phosphate synthase
MNILDKIVQNKRREIAEIKKLTNPALLEKTFFFDAERPSFYDSLLKKGPSLITEFKRRSPSKGEINAEANVAEVVRGYEHAGASAVSILTDTHFDGRPEDIQTIFKATGIPVLRKDFILDEIQLFEARAWGASAILLIAAILDKNEIEKLTARAYQLGLDVLLELHAEEEMHKVPENARIIGVNNRNLKTFQVDLVHSVKLAEKLPAGVLKVSESGISSVETVIQLYQAGFRAFLMGENFMKAADPGSAAEKFIRGLEKQLKN